MSNFSARIAFRGARTSHGFPQRSDYCRRWLWVVVGVWALVTGGCGGCGGHGTSADSADALLLDDDGVPLPDALQPSLHPELRSAGDKGATKAGGGRSQSDSSTAAKAVQPKKSGTPTPSGDADEPVFPTPQKPASTPQKRAPTPPKPDRPIDLADWKPSDYDSGLRAGDPRFLAAIGWLGEHSTDKETAGDQLVKLLESSVVALDMAPPTPGMKTKVTEAIVAALGVNGTPHARECLERLVAGTLKTADNQAAATAALKALLSQPRPENEDLFFRVLTAPQQPATADRAAPDPQILQQTAVSMINSAASESFRVRLANCMASTDLPSAVYEKLWALLAEPRSENLAAQVVLYESDQPDESQRQQLEHLIGVRSAAALAKLLGIPLLKDRPRSSATSVSAKTVAEPPRIGGVLVDSDGVPLPAAAQLPTQKAQTSARPKEAADWRLAASASDPYPVAGLLWTPDFAATIERRLRMIDGMEQGESLMLLASTVPSQPVRAALLRMLEKFWEEGPKGLDLLTAAETAVSEPGFLLLVKRLHRKDLPAAPANNAATGHGPNSNPTSGKTARVVGDREAKQQAERDAKQQRDQTAQHWMTFSDDLVRAMCQRFYAAALAKKAADNDSSDLPLAVHPNAQVVASYCADWPDGLQGKLAGLPIPPLRVHYLRIEQKARPSKLLAFYRRQLPSGDEHANPHGVWFDDLNVNKEQGTVRSIDILIAKPSKSTPLVLTQEQEVIVELLAVECAWSAERNPLSSGK
jgi:hypothetical protein